MEGTLLEKAFFMWTKLIFAYEREVHLYHNDCENHPSSYSGQRPACENRRNEQKKKNAGPHREPPAASPLPPLARSGREGEGEPPPPPSPRCRRSTPSAPPPASSLPPPVRSGREGGGEPPPPSPRHRRPPRRRRLASLLRRPPRRRRLASSPLLPFAATAHRRRQGE